MPLNPTDRRIISKTIVEAELRKAEIDLAIASLQAALVDAQAKDDANKNIIDNNNLQGLLAEYGLLSGNLKVSLTPSELEDAIQASASLSQSTGSNTSGNLFYPNNPLVSPPSVWTKLVPYAAVLSGNQFSGSAVTPVTGEISQLNTLISTITSLITDYFPVERGTGERASEGGTCSLISNPPILGSGIPVVGAITNATCTAGGGVWSAGSDSVFAAPDIVARETIITNAITALDTYLNNYAALDYTNAPEPPTAVSNAAAAASVTTLKNAIATWLAAPVPTPSLAVTAAAFYALNPNNRFTGDLFTGTLGTLLVALQTRLALISPRATQLLNALGTLTQNLSTGAVSGSGYLLSRYLYVNLRVGLMGGSVIALNGINRAIQGQNDLKAAIDSEKLVYQTLMDCSALVAPANGTQYLSVRDATGFTAGQTVTLIADQMPEALLTIDQIVGNRIRFTTETPKFYFTDQFARIFFDKT